MNLLNKCFLRLIHVQVQIFSHYHPPGFTWMYGWTQSINID